MPSQDFRADAESKHREYSWSYKEGPDERKSLQPVYL